MRERHRIHMVHMRRERAAIVLQSAWKGIQCRRQYVELRARQPVETPLERVERQAALEQAALDAEVKKFFFNHFLIYSEFIIYQFVCFVFV
jgi:hypothetical protein